METAIQVNIDIFDESKKSIPACAKNPLPKTMQSSFIPDVPVRRWANHLRGNSEVLKGFKISPKNCTSFQEDLLGSFLDVPEGYKQEIFQPLNEVDDTDEWIDNESFLERTVTR